MSHYKFCILLLAVLLTAVATDRPLYAELITNSQSTQAIVDSFNSLNNNRGFHHDSTVARPSQALLVSGPMVDTDAYTGTGTFDGIATSTENYFRTFCVEPNIPAAKGYGTLSYLYSGASVTSGGHYLTVGAAYLYSQFAQGFETSYNIFGDDILSHPLAEANLQAAIRSLMIGDDGLNVWNQGTRAISWSNVYLREMLNDIENDYGFWTAKYDPGQYYDIIGDYSVFVMNVANEYGVRGQQDLLYVAYNDFVPDIEPEPSVTPEPASILIFGAGLVGLSIAYRRKQRRN